MQNLLWNIQRSFSKGYNDSYPPELLPDGYCAKAQNCFLENEAIERATGCTMIANDLGSKRCLGLGSFENNVTGTKQLLSAFDNSGDAQSQLYYWAGSGNWTLITGSDINTADTNTEFEMAANKIYAYNGVNSAQSWDGSARATVAAIPVTYFMKWFHNYMFAFNHASYPSRLYFSNLLLPETWGATDYIDINPNDGDKGTALAILGDELVLGKRNRIWSFTGWGETTWDIKTIAERITGCGIMSHRGVVNVGNDLYFISAVGGVPQIRSLTRTRYATVISGGVIGGAANLATTLSGLNTGQLNIAASMFDGENAWFFLPNGSDTYNSLALRYNLPTKGWTSHTGKYASAAITSMVTGTPIIYFGESRADSKVYKLDSSYSNNGEAIPMDFRSRTFLTTGRTGAVRPYVKSKWKYLFVTAERTGDVDIDIDASADGYSFSDVATMNCKSQQSVFPFTFPVKLGTTDVVRKRMNLGLTSFGCGLRFQHEVADETVKIREYQIGFKPRGIRAID